MTVFFWLMLCLYALLPLGGIGTGHLIAQTKKRWPLGHMVQILIAVAAVLGIWTLLPRLRDYQDKRLSPVALEDVVLFLTYACAWVSAQLYLVRRDCAKVERKLREVEVIRLKTQLNPHFLFNSLTAVSELGYSDPRAADFVVTELSVLLRKSLDEERTQEISLRDELEFLRRYLGIQQVLLRDSISIQFHIDEHVLQARVPGMILQPLAENAVIHGISVDGVARLDIRASRRDTALVIDVEDQGAGLEAVKGSARSGIGVFNIRTRLEYLYGDEASLELHNRSGGGVTARLQIPYHEAFAYNEAANVNYR